MNDDKTGGPAFPLCRTEEGGINDCLHTGMMLRDWFAGMALQGMLAANAQMHDEVTDKNVDQVIAREAYASADAMLQERMKPKP